MDEDGWRGEDEEWFDEEEDADDGGEGDGGDDDEVPLPGVSPALSDMLGRLRGHPMFEFLAQLGGIVRPLGAAGGVGPGVAAAGAFPVMPGGMGGMGGLALPDALRVPIPPQFGGGGGGGAQTEVEPEQFFRTLLAMTGGLDGLGGATAAAAAAAGVAVGTKRTPEQVVAAQDAWLEAQAAETARIQEDAEQLLAVPDSTPVFVDVAGVTAVKQQASSAAVRAALKDAPFVEALLQKMAARAGSLDAPLGGPLLQKTVQLLHG